MHPSSWQMRRPAAPQPGGGGGGHAHSAASPPLFSNPRRQPPRQPRLTVRAAAAAGLGAGLALMLLLSLLGTRTVPEGGGVRKGASATGGASGGVDAVERGANIGPRRPRPQPQPQPPGDKAHIAIAIPYLPSPGSDPCLPPYFGLFAATAAGSVGLVDFLIFHPGLTALPDAGSLPPNVRLIDLGSTEAMAELLLRVTDRRGQGGDDGDGGDGTGPLAMDHRKLVKMVARTLVLHPYVLVEYKPATGHVFADYLGEYTHWGYSDLDIAWGDLPRWITPDELDGDKWDVVTYGFGDQDRAYLRGQFTFHRNDPERINQLWRGCDYLARADERYGRLLSGEGKFSMESAEGCYSAAVLARKDIRVKYAVKALTDAEGKGAAGIAHRGLYVGRGRARDRSVVWTAGGLQDEESAGKSAEAGEAKEAEAGRLLRELSLAWFEDEQLAPAYAGDAPLQWEVGPRTRIRSYRDEYGDDGAFEKCMYWAPKTYQRDVCLMDVDWFLDTVMLIDGTLYKQRFQQVDFPRGVVTYPFFHFQEWKRYYRRGQLGAVEGAGSLASSAQEVAGWVVTENGAVPLPDTEGRPIPASDRASNLFKGQNPAASPESYAFSLPTRRYCLRSSIHKLGGGRPPSVQCDETISWKDESRVAILAAGNGWVGRSNAPDDVTLTLTLQITLNDDDVQANDHYFELIDGLLDVAETNMEVWSGSGGQPSLLLLHVGGATKEAAVTIQERFQTKNLDAHMNLCLVAVIFSKETHYVSRNALLNMAADAAGTRFVVSGLEVERGLVVSQEASLFARRMAAANWNRPANIFILPQFASTDNTDATSMSLADILDGRPSIGEDLSSHDCTKCKDHGSNLSLGADLIDAINTQWKYASRLDVGKGEKGRTGGAKGALEVLVLQLLTLANTKALRDFDQSPIMMVDKLGPIDGAITSQIVPAVEEMVGSRCYSALRLAQLAALEYTIDVLPGAFAASTKASRAFVCTEDLKLNSSSCRSCSIIEDDVLQDLAIEEKVKVGEATVLWREIYKIGL